MIRIIHVISDFSTGGAATMLANLVGGMDRSRFANSIIALTDRSQLSDLIEAAGTPVHCLDMRRGRADLSALPQFIRLLSAAKPMLVQSWLYHADFLSLIGARFAGSPPVVWNLRCSDMDLTYYPRQTRLVLRALALLSRFPAAVVVNSLTGQALHQKLGYRAKRWEVIPNGFDLIRFRPDVAARQRLRHELGVSADTVLVALVARVDPMKDHRTFLEAASRISVKRRGVQFLLVGRGTQMLRSKVAEIGVEHCIHLLGLREDVDRLLPGVDIACLTSAFGEGFPNVLGEAMACGVPCVSTDVGDAREIISDGGLIVPPRDPEALAGAIVDLIDRGLAGREILGQAARARIEKEYALPGIIERYQALYEDLCGRAS